MQSILSDKSIVAFLGLAEMVVISANQFDLSVGYMVSLLHSLAIGLMVAGVPWPLVCLLTLGIGLAIGLAQWRAGPLRQDRQLHRDPGRRHRRLRVGRLVHRRRADHRRPAPWLHRARQHARARPAAVGPAAAGAGGDDVGRVRVPADRPLPLRHRRQRAHGRADRHPRQPLRHRRLLRVRAGHGTSRRCCWRPASRSGRAMSGRSSCCPPSSAHCSAPPRCGRAG